MADPFADPFDEAPIPQPPKKKSLFKRPVPKPVAAVGGKDEAVDFFRRSHEVFPKHLDEQRRRREKKAARSERKRSSASLEKTEDQPSQEKKRRISSQEINSSDEDAGMSLKCV